jgi:hypothetical protein
MSGTCAMKLCPEISTYSSSTELREDTIWDPQPHMGKILIIIKQMQCVGEH